MSAQWTLSGGGEITWTGAFVKWSSRVIVLPVDLTYGVSGFFDIDCPTSGTITGYINASGSSLVTCTAAGIPLSSWHALYYIIRQGATNTFTQTNFVVVNYTNSTYKIDSSWLLIAMRSGDMGTLKWIPGNENIPSSGTINLVTGYRSWQVINKFYYSENIAGASPTQAGNFRSITISASGTAFVSFNCLHRAASFTGGTSAVYWSLRKNSTTISASALGTRWLSFAAAAFPSTNTSSDNWQPLSMVWSGTVSSGDIIHVHIAVIESTLGINDAYLSITVI